MNKKYVDKNPYLIEKRKYDYLWRKFGSDYKKEI